MISHGVLPHYQDSPRALHVGRRSADNHPRDSRYGTITSIKSGGADHSFSCLQPPVHNGLSSASTNRQPSDMQQFPCALLVNPDGSSRRRTKPRPHILLVTTNRRSHDEGIVWYAGPLTARRRCARCLLVTDCSSGIYGGIECCPPGNNAEPPVGSLPNGRWDREPTGLPSARGACGGDPERGISDPPGRSISGVPGPA